MGPGGWGLEGADRTDARSLGRMEIPPSVLQDIVPFGSAAQKAPINPLRGKNAPKIGTSQRYTDLVERYQP